MVTVLIRGSVWGYKPDDSLIPEAFLARLRETMIVDHNASTFLEGRNQLTEHVDGVFVGVVV